MRKRLTKYEKIYIIITYWFVKVLSADVWMYIYVVPTKNSLVTPLNFHSLNISEFFMSHAYL